MQDIEQLCKGEDFESFIEEISTGLGKVSTRFVKEFILGILQSRSLKLTDISRFLQEDISLHATQKRLSRNLGDPEIALSVGRKILELAGRKIRKNSLILIHPIKLRKKYARSMEYMSSIESSQNARVETECHLWDVVSCELETEVLTPVLLTPWSSNNREITEEESVRLLTEKVRAASKGNGLLVTGRSGDKRDLLVPWAADKTSRFLVRQRDNSMLMHNKRLYSVAELAEMCDTPYGKTIFKYLADASFSEYGFPDKQEVDVFIHFGFLPVRLPEHPDRPLSLLVLKSEYQDSQVFLTTEPLRRNRQVLSEMLQVCFKIDRIGRINRGSLLTYDFDDVRVLSFARLKNMLALIQAASYFSATRQKLTLDENTVEFHRRATA
jgi:hypothetical protein